MNAYFNSIDQLSAYFVQKNPNGQQAEGNLSMRRPGQFHFAYAPPSTLEVVSDGRNVAIRDKKLGTNDVYPVGQTPLKFLVQDNIDLSRDTYCSVWHSLRLDTPLEVTYALIDG